jgi:hypothetical protein
MAACTASQWAVHHLEASYTLRAAAQATQVPHSAQVLVR